MTTEEHFDEVIRAVVKTASDKYVFSTNSAERRMVIEGMLNSVVIVMASYREVYGSMAFMTRKR